MEKRRTRNFREDETKLLIELWSSPVIQNQINSSHRKDPIMRQIAAAMQQHGFYRTHEEIKTRLRNLKCLYYRTKKSLSMGMLNPDWPHFEAMDAVLGDNVEPPGVNTSEFVNYGHFKQEKDIDEVTTSMTGVDSMSTTYEDDTGTSTASSPLQGIPVTSSPFAMPGPSSILGQRRASMTETKHRGENFSEPRPKRCRTHAQDEDIPNLLRQILDVGRQQLELEKQRLEFDRLVGTQLMSLIPMMGSIIQSHLIQQNRLIYPTAMQQQPDWRNSGMNLPKIARVMSPASGEEDLSSGDDEIT